MADLTATLAFLAPLAPTAVALSAMSARSARLADRIGRWAGLVAAVPALCLAALALTDAGGKVEVGSWWIVDAPGAVFLAVVGLVGASGAAFSPAFLRTTSSSRAGSVGARRLYWGGFHLFWAALIAVALANNLGVAWVLIEATTAASALLVAFSGGRRALEAGWKYLVLTGVGLTVALFGIVLLYGAPARGVASLEVLDWSQLAGAAKTLDPGVSLIAFVLITAGLATKAGWAPVHNWLPDAHSEAPPPISALMSAALLPAVALVAWRLALALRPAVGVHAVQAVFVGLGLASLAVAVPFLWRPLPWKRLLAYSSLEHMGVLALAIGFQQPLATAGALLHVAAHGVAKSLGFSAALPLLRYQPAAGRRPPRGLAAQNSSLAWAVGLSLGTLSGLPPSPLFFSEILILAGGFAAGLVWVSAAAAVLLALGFLGMVHVLVEGLAGRPSGRRPSSARGTRLVLVATVVSVCLLIALSAVAYRLPGSEIVASFTGGA